MTRKSVLRGAFLLVAGGVLFGAAACGGHEPPAITEAPIFPGAMPRETETALQRRLLAVLLGPRAAAANPRLYGTAAGFASVVDFYEPYAVAGTLTVRRFAVASRMRELAQRAREGSPQPLAVGRLLFGEGGAPPAEPLAGAAVADSLDALATRFAGVEGLLAIGRLRLARNPPVEILLSVEHPHLDLSTRTLDSTTVFTLVEQPVSAR